MKRHSPPAALLICLAALAAFAGCITVSIPKPNPSSTSPSSATVPPADVPVNSGVRPVIASFYANPASVPIGVATTLVWNVTGANAVSIDNGIGAVALSGSRTLLPASTTVYTITATNSNGTNMASTQVVVSTSYTPPAPTPAPTPTPQPSNYNQPVINYFTVTPSNITMGSYAQLNWSVSNASSVVISPSIGAVAASGSMPVQPSQSITFTLTAAGPGGSTASNATLYVAATAQPMTADWTGTWQTGSYGWDNTRIYLTQVGNSVTGTYDYQNGRISGTASGLTLIGTWAESPTYTGPHDAGPFSIAMSPDGSSYSGTWQYDTDSSSVYTWSGDRIR